VALTTVSQLVQAGTEAAVLAALQQHHQWHLAATGLRASAAAAAAAVSLAMAGLAAAES
jgi:hypothetical protein